MSRCVLDLMQVLGFRPVFREEKGIFRVDKCTIVNPVFELLERKSDLVLEIFFYQFNLLVIGSRLFAGVQLRWVLADFL